MDEPNYFAVIPANVRYDNELRANEKLLYGEITSLTKKTGECWASNKYFGDLYGVKPNAVATWIKHLKDKQYIEVDYEYEGKEIKKRIIRIGGIQKDIGGIHKKIGGYSQKGEENNININNKLNEFNLYNNFHENKSCDCITKANTKCLRKSSFNINGKNYCNQHARDLIPNLKIQVENYFDNEELNEMFIEFLQLRKKLKAVNSDRAVKLLLSKLNEYDDETKYKMIEQSIVNSWKSIYEIKNFKQSNKTEIVYETI